MHLLESLIEKIIRSEFLILITEQIRFQDLVSTEAKLTQATNSSLLIFCERNSHALHRRAGGRSHTSTSTSTSGLLLAELRQGAEGMKESLRVLL